MLGAEAREFNSFESHCPDWLVNQFTATCQWGSPLITDQRVFKDSHLSDLQREVQIVQTEPTGVVTL